MRVLMTTDCVGGVWTYTMTLCRALQRHGVEITLAITGGPMSNAQTREVDQIANVDWHHRPYRCEWMQPPLADVAAAGEWLESLWDECVPDVVHLNDFAHGNRWFGHCPRLIVAHSDVVSWHRAVRQQDPDDSWNAYRVAVAGGLGEADAVVGLTEGGLAEVCDAFCVRPRRRRVIYNATDLYPRSSKFGEPFILAAGRLWDEAKNLDVLAVAAEGLPWPVKLAGDPQHPDGGSAAESNANVELLGPVSHGRLVSLMSEATIFAAPARYEPFGLAIAEAARCGCALLLGRIPSLYELWREDVRYFDPFGFNDGIHSMPGNDPDVLRDILAQMIDRPDALHRQGVAAMERSLVFDPRVQAAAYHDLYIELAKSGRGGAQ